MVRLPLREKQSIVQRILAIGLSALMLAGNSPAETGLVKGSESAPKQLEKHGSHMKIASEDQAIHLLNRFSFGPTEADIAAVKRLGVYGWFEEQLHPERSADAELERRLAELPAMKMPVSDLLWRFPNGAAIRQTANGNREMPADPTLKAIYARHIALHEAKQEKKAAGGEKVSGMPADGKSHELGSEAEKRPAEGETIAAVLKLAPEARLRRILAMSPGEYGAFSAGLKGADKMRVIEGMSPEERETLEDFENPTQTVVEEEQAQRLLREIYSSRQLEEVMTSFWMNHFNVYLHKNEQEPYYLVSYERDVIRPRALGNFEDLLIATAESPAMLLYLDNAASTGPNSQAAERQQMRATLGKPSKGTPEGLNENYARELMELHTLGVRGGYTQKDVTEVAKVFTGWTVEKPQQGGGFLFDVTRHEPGTKTVLGKPIHGNGMQEGLEVLHRLASSPATARFLSRELAVAFVSDTPSEALVRRMAGSFTASHGEIKAVLRTMVHSPEFWQQEAYRGKIKTPLEYVVSAVRLSGAEVTDARPLIHALNQMGMPLYGCVPPTGYGDKAGDWISTGALVTRMNFALTLATNRYPQIKVSWAPWISGGDQASIALHAGAAYPAPEQTESLLERQLVPGGISEKTRLAVLQQMSAPANSAGKEPVTQTIAQESAKALAAQQWQIAQMAGLLIGSPEFQRR